MEDLLLRIERAKNDEAELERLVSDYIPFIKSETGKFSAASLEYDDKLSLGMLVFVNCVKQYDRQRGAFLSYASVCIRNRLTDETRKTGKAKSNTVAFDAGTEDTATEEKASLEIYSRNQEQSLLKEEIDTLAQKLAVHGLSFEQLAHTGPKQKRSRALCADLAAQVLRDRELRAAFCEHGRLPQKELARRAGISEKTIEKHRRYIVALLVILQGDYPGIGSYIPGYREVE